MNRPVRVDIFSALVFALGFAAFSSPVFAAEPGAPEKIATAQFIPANDPRFRYEGRIDFSDRSGPVVVWQGSRIRLDFAGTQLSLRFGGAIGQNFFNAEVDGVNTVVAANEGGERRLEVPLPGPGRHRLVLFKRSEATAGQARFAGVEIAAGAAAGAPPAPGYKLRMEFFGDSIMVGACNEDGAMDQWADRHTHNNALSYTTLTAAAFSADYRCLAVSGMGVATGWTELKAGQAWDRLYPRADAPRADLSAWQPDVAFLNFGENDDSFPRAHGQEFPAGYTTGYVALVKAIRAAYPRTQLVILRGGMYGGAQSAPLREAWTAVGRRLEADDPGVSHFVFTHWSSNHPRVSDDRIMADELIAWLKARPFMQKYLDPKN
jgi:lysophospholipase L1-like esterase